MGEEVVVAVPTPEVTSEVEVKVEVPAAIAEVITKGPAVLEHAEKKPLTREQLAQAVRAELQDRSKRAMSKIEAILREENCVLEARISLPEVSPGIFGLTAEPGVRAL
jgi:hypothetical protein